MTVSTTPRGGGVKLSLGALAGALLLSLAAPSARQGPDQPPRLRSGVDVVRVEASVLDKNRRPVRGLTADDFVVLENFASARLRRSPPSTCRPPRRWRIRPPGSLAPAQFANHRTANVRLPLAAGELPLGQYLLPFEASAGDLRAERLVRFEIR